VSAYFCCILNSFLLPKGIPTSKSNLEAKLVKKTELVMQQKQGISKKKVEAFGDRQCTQHFHLIHRREPGGGGAGEQPPFQLTFKSVQNRTTVGLQLPWRRTTIRLQPPSKERTERLYDSNSHQKKEQNDCTTPTAIKRKNRTTVRLQQPSKEHTFTNKTMNSSNNPTPPHAHGNTY
jgi:hypothetical protein